MSQPLAIALIRQRYTQDGGAEQFVNLMMQALGHHRLRLTLVTRRWDVLGDSQIVVCDPIYVGRLWRDWSFARSACRAIRLRKFDIVQSHERVTCCDVYRAGDGLHREWLVQRARLLTPLRRVMQQVNPYHWYLRRAERRLFTSERLRLVICNSDMVREEICRHFGFPRERIQVIRNGVDTTRFNPSVKAYRSDIRRKNEIPVGATLFLFVGSGFERKGVRILLQAFARLGGNAFLLIVGRDKNAPRYQRLAEQLGVSHRVRFLGGQPEVAPYYGAADILVLPTLYDPFPNVVAEAWSCGLPVITSDKCGAAELIVRGVDGEICDATNADALVKCLRWFLSVDDKQGLSAAVLRKAKELTLARMSVDFVRAYRGLIEERRVERSRG